MWCGRGEYGVVWCGVVVVWCGAALVFICGGGGCWRCNNLQRSLQQKPINTHNNQFQQSTLQLRTSPSPEDLGSLIPPFCHCLCWCWLHGEDISIHNKYIYDNSNIFNVFKPLCVLMDNRLTWITSSPRWSSHPMFFYIIIMSSGALFIALKIILYAWKSHIGLRSKLHGRTCKH